MPRRLSVETHEMGRLELYLIYENDGVWEREWLPLQGSPITGLLTVVSKETMDHCLHGWSKPLFKALGLPPWGTLKKVPEAAKACHKKDDCPFFSKKQCFPEAKNLPWCFEPGISDDVEARILANEIVKYWREGVYVVVVQESSNA